MNSKKLDLETMTIAEIAALDERADRKQDVAAEPLVRVRRRLKTGIRGGWNDPIMGQ